MNLRLLRIVPIALALAGCASYSTVSEKRPPYHPAQTSGGALAPVNDGILNALKRELGNPLDALGGYLAAADEASRLLARNPGDRAARDVYNFAVARIFTAIKDGKLDPWTQPLHVPGAGGEYILSHRPIANKFWHPALYDFTAADEFTFHGLYVNEHTLKDGVGAPVLAVGKAPRGGAKEDFAMEKVYYGVTAVARFQGRHCEIALEDPLAVETTTLNGHTYPLAADFTVALAVVLARENPAKLELSRLLRPDSYAETAHIVRTQPYDPNKTVVVVTHGLKDSPATWTPMLNSLRGDPVIRQHYQFWFYSYPSGYPYPYSASIMRKQLDAIEKKFPLKKKIVLIGHSMGSMISRLMITDSGDKLWMTTFGKPPEQVKLSPESRELLEGAMIFKHRSEVGRVIFIAGPHRGSDLATHWAGRLGASLVRAPRKLLSVGNEMRKAVVQDPSSLQLNRIPNSIDTLAPNNRFVKTVNTIPITPGIPYHTISGDRGKGGNRDHTAPCCSDGIVPYWSSHLDGAESELIVPSNHSAHQNPQAIAEVKRILVKYAR